MWSALVNAAPLISAGASIVGGMMGSDSASSAADAQSQASAASIAEQRRQFDQTRADQAPFRNTGVAANARLAQLLGLSTTGASNSFDTISASPEFNKSNSDAIWNDLVLNHGMPFANASQVDALKQATADAYISKYGNPTAAPQSADYGSLLRKFSASDLAADPVYNSGLEFGRSEGAGAINARALAGGNYDSGATLKALTRFGNDYGSTKAEGAYNRYNTDNTNIYNRLAGVSGAGQTATNAITTAGQNATNNISNSIEGAGNARAAGIVGGANAWGGAMGGVSGAVNNYQSNQLLQKLLNRYNGGWGYGNSTNYADGYGPI